VTVTEELTDRVDDSPLVRMGTLGVGAAARYSLFVLATCSLFPSAIATLAEITINTKKTSPTAMYLEEFKCFTSSSFFTVDENLVYPG
jgi:hypothetical protein